MPPRSLRVAAFGQLAAFPSSRFFSIGPADRVLVGGGVRASFIVHEQWIAPAMERSQAAVVGVSGRRRRSHGRVLSFVGGVVQR
jgi:hypothetical protein